MSPVTETASRVAEIREAVGPGTGRSAVVSFRLWATRHRVLAALLAGFVAVHVATIIGFWMGDFGLKRQDWPTANGLIYVPHAGPLALYVVGGVAHYLDGIFFALVFAIGLAPYIRIRGTLLGNLAKGVIFGVVLALVSLTVMTPLVYAPARGSVAGVFSSNFGGVYIASVFVFHIVYGLHLGLIYNPYDETSPECQEQVAEPQRG